MGRVVGCGGSTLPGRLTVGPLLPTSSYQCRHSLDASMLGDTKTELACSRLLLQCIPLPALSYPCLPVCSCLPLPCSKEEYEFTDPDTNRTYYVDPLTKKTSWDKPDELWWVEVQSEDGECGVWWPGRDAMGGRAGMRARGQFPVVCCRLRWIEMQAEGGEWVSARGSEMRIGPAMAELPSCNSAACRGHTEVPGIPTAPALLRTTTSFALAHHYHPCPCCPAGNGTYYFNEAHGASQWEKVGGAGWRGCSCIVCAECIVQQPHPLNSLLAHTYSPSA